MPTKSLHRSTLTAPRAPLCGDAITRARVTRLEADRVQLEYLRDGGHWEIIAYAPLEHEEAWRGWLTTPDGGAR